MMRDLLTLIGLPRRTKLRARGPIPSAALWRSPGEDELMSIGSHEVVEFGLSGRPLYVCQSMWWLRLSQLKTCPPDALELRDYAPSFRSVLREGREVVQ